MKMKHNHKASASLSMIGIASTIILAQILFSYFFVSLTNQELLNSFQDSCDCGTLGCSAYLVTHGFSKTFDLCEQQSVNNQQLDDSITQWFTTMKVFTIILFVMNMILLLIIILILRGIDG